MPVQAGHVDDPDAGLATRDHDLAIEERPAGRRRLVSQSRQGNRELLVEVGELGSADLPVGLLRQLEQAYTFYE